jgi:anti-sigma regulatory factor (Ser/Thr protein kinase)
VISAKLRRRRHHEGATTQFTLRATPSAAGQAREAVRHILLTWDLEPLADTAMLLSSELVTNAVRHAGTRLHVELSRLPIGGLRIAVSDAAPGDWPRVNQPGVDDEGGRGMWLVDKLATTWGTTTGRRGKSVWFELLLDAMAVEEGAG